MNCPRCNRQLYQRYDDQLCIIHGTIEQPVVTIEQAQAEVKRPSRYRGPVVKKVYAREFEE